MEIRCDSKILHGKIVEGMLEVPCRSKRCGKEPGVVVLHRFDLSTGHLVSTIRFRQPEEETHNAHS